MNNEISFSSIIKVINKDVFSLLDQHLNKKEYNHTDARIWSNQIVQKILQYLSDFNGNFKYMVNCIITQKAECSLSIGRSVQWDSELDGELSLNWENDEILCVLTVYGISL